MSKLDIQGKLVINSSGILELNGNPYVDFNAAGQLALGNQDWLPLCGSATYLSHPGSSQADAQGTVSSISFDYNAGGMKFVGQGTAHIQARIPVDKFSKYRIKIRAKKTVTAQNTITTPSAHTDMDLFYCGVSNFDSDHANKFTDGATTYNYGVAMSQYLSTDGSITSGSSSYPGNGTTGNSDGEYVFENTISGFNLASEGDHTKFDPGTSYFNIVIICNYIGLGQSNSDLVETVKGETIIQNIEVERVSSWGTNSSDSPADTALYFTNPSQNYYPGLMPTDYGAGWDGLVQMVGRGEWVDENALSGSGDGRGWAFWPASGAGAPTLFIQEQKSNTPTELGAPGNMNYPAGTAGEKNESIRNVPLWLIGQYAQGDLLIGSNHPVARFQQNYTIPSRTSPNGDYIDINVVGYNSQNATSDIDYAGMAIESGWGNLFLGSRNIHKQSDGGTHFPELSNGLPRNEWGMIIDMKNLVHIGIPSGVDDGNWRRMDISYGKEVLNLHGAVKFTSITGPRSGSGSAGKGTLWWRDDTGPGAFYYRAPDGTDKVLGSGDVTFNYSGTLWEGYNADRIGTDNTVHFSKTSLNQLDLNPAYYNSTSTSGMALGCGWGQSDATNRPAIQIASAANSAWAAIYLNKIGVTGPHQAGNDTRYIQFGVNGDSPTSFRSSGSDGKDFQIHSTQQISLSAHDGVAISDSATPKEAYSILDVEGSDGQQGGQLYVSSTADFAENNGGGILFGAKVSASNRALTGSIHGVKSNGTDGDYKGDLIFTTRSGLTGTTNDLFQEGSIMPERMRIRHDGNVGIGTASPFADITGWENRSGALHIQGAQPRLRLQDDEPASDGAWDIVNHAGDLFFQSREFDGSGNFVDGSANNTVKITQGGNVGIGTDSPNEMLHIIGHARVEGPGDAGGSAVLYFGDAVGQPNHRYIAGDISGNILIRPSDTSYIGFMGGGQEKMRISPEGNVGIGTDSPDKTLDVAGDINFSGNIYQNGSVVSFDTAAGGGSGTLWSSSGSDLHYNAGNVGIGTTSPGHKLHVAGGTPSMKLEGTQPRIWLTETDQTDLNTLIRNNNSIFQIDTVNDDDSFLAHRFSINNTSGNVGIGTVEPFALFTVQESVSKVQFEVDPDQDRVLISSYNRTGTPAPQPLKFSASRHTFHDGDVGIGTDSPQALLHLEHANDAVYSPTSMGHDKLLARIRNRNSSNASGQFASINLITSGNGGTTNSELSLNCVQTADGDTASDFTVQQRKSDTTYHETMRIDSDGNVTHAGNLEAKGQITSNRRVMSENSLDLISDYNDDEHQSTISFKIDGQDAANEKMRIDTDGNVGIGTTSPDCNLHIKGSDSADGGETKLCLESADGTQNAAIAHVDENGAERLSIRIGGHSASVDKMTILNSGDVGIGTTSPDFKLTVDNGIGNEGLKVIAGNNGDSVESVFEAWNNKVNGSAPELLFKIRGDGNVGIGTTSPSEKLEVAAPVMSIFRNTNDVLLRNGLQFKFGDSASADIPQLYGAIGALIEKNTAGSHDGALVFTTTKNGEHTIAQERMRITSNGNVGIGTTSPLSQLSVYSEIDEPYSDVTPGVSDSIIGLRNAPTSEAANNHASLQFNLDAGTHNHIASISLVSESETLRRGALAFCTDNGTTRPEAMRIDSAGNVGIGTTSPDCKLRVEERGGNPLTARFIDLGTSTDVSGIRLGKSHNEGANAVYMDLGLDSVENKVGIGIGLGNNSLPLGEADLSNAEIVLDSAGNVGIGTASPQEKFHVHGTMMLSDTPAPATTTNKLYANSGNLYWNGSELTGGTGGGSSIWTENYKTAEYFFPGYDALGTDTGKVRIYGKDGQPGSCVRFESYIQNGASFKFAELGVTVPSGTTTADHAGYVLMSSRDASMYRIWFSNVGDLRTSGNATHIGAASGTVVGDQSSDERLKDIKPDFGYGLEQVMQLAPIEYSFKSDSESKNRLGFGAQSTQSIIPEAVYDTDECLDGYEPASNTDEQSQPKSDETKLAMQYVQLIPVLTKAIQELKAENDDLKSRLESIEEWRGNSV